MKSRHNDFRRVFFVGAIIFLTFLTQAFGLNHLWRISEIYSNDDGTVQFIELFNNSVSTIEGFLSVTSFTTDSNSYFYPSDLVGDTAFKRFLMATPDFNDLPGAPAPDYIIPANFFDPDGDTLTFVFSIGSDAVTFGPGQLPVDGINSIDRDLVVGLNSPTNFAAAAGSVVSSVTDPIPTKIAKGDIEIELETLVVGMASPVYLADPNDGTGRLFIVDQPGQIRIYKDGFLLNKPFLDVSDRIVSLGFFGTLNPFTDFDERGLLGVAFHPDFSTPATNGFGKIYTYTSEPNDFAADFTVSMPVGVAFNHQAIITEWTVDNNDPNVIDKTTRRELLRIDEPQFNHDGGMVAFGPDGYLYISLGDGGSGRDTADGHGTIGNGQDPTNVLGSILRIDVDGSDSVNGAYGIVASNPFVGDSNIPDEIYAYGFRNPWRFSFDTVTGDLIVGDVGQGDIEEVDTVISGGNYGWNLKEGSFRFDPNTGTVNNDLSGLPGGLIDPNAEYDHDEGSTVIGGFVYRGSEIPELVGKYVFGDFTTGFFSPDGRLFYADPATGWEIKELIIGLDDRALGLYLKAFGQDSSGELYVLAGTNLGPFSNLGQVLKIVNTDCSVGQAHVIPGDINKDCKIDYRDFAALAAHWLECTEGPEIDCGI